MVQARTFLEKLSMTAWMYALDCRAEAQSKQAGLGFLSDIHHAAVAYTFVRNVIERSSVLDNGPDPCHTYCMTSRINARLDADLARKVGVLRKRTGQSTTEIVKASLESYYVAMTREESPAALLSEFIGCASGPADLSTSYKQQLTKSLLRKHRT
jgi:hypothetical protein